MPDTLSEPTILDSLPPRSSQAAAKSPLMTPRLAHLVSQATDPDGYLDRTQLYESLSIDPTDPVAIIIEAFLATENSRQLLKGSIVEEHEAAEGALRRIAEDIADIAAVHNTQLAAAVDELKAGREATDKIIRAHLGTVGEQSDKLHASAGKLQTAADYLRTQSRGIFFLLGLLVGAGLALAVVFTFLGKVFLK
jgi:hypothetical protein